MYHIIKKFHQKICRVYPVDPLGGVLHIVGGRLSRHGIAENHFSHSLSAEQANIKFFHRGDPVGNPILVNLKTQFPIDISRVGKSEVPMDIPVKVSLVEYFMPSSSFTSSVFWLAMSMRM